MKNVLRIEEAAMFLLCIYVLYFLQVSWWVYLLVLVAPDISILGYLAGNTAGALCYNFFHHKAVAITVIITGFVLKDQWVQIVGIILLGHSSMDRMVGYGLKLKEGFKNTHLGAIGKG